MPTVPAYRDLNLFGVEKNLAFGHGGEVCASLKISPQWDQRMCDTSELPSYVEGFSRLLAGLPIGYGVLFECEVKELVEGEQSKTELNLPEILKEIQEERQNHFRGKKRIVEHYAHVWANDINPLKIPLLPRLVPKKKQENLETSLNHNLHSIEDVVSSLESSLGTLQVKTKRLNNEGIIQRYWEILSPQKSNIAPVKVDPRYTLRSQLMAHNSYETPEFYFADGFYHAAVTFYEFPEELILGKIDDLIDILPVGTRFVQTITVPDQEQYLGGLKKQHIQAEGLMRESNSKDFESEARHIDLDEIITRCRQEGERIYVSWAGFILRSENLDELKDWKKKIVRWLNEFIGATGLAEDLLHRRTFFASLPMNSLLSPRRNIMLGSTATALAPLSHPWRGAKTGLELMGHMKDPLHIDLFEDNSPRHGIVVAMTGGGKSFTANMLILSASTDPTLKTLVIDIGGSYRRIAEILNGSYFDVKIDEQFAINPLLPKASLLKSDGSFDPEMMGAQTSLLMRFLPEGVSGQTRVIIEKAIERSYLQKDEPLLSDFYEILKNGPWDSSLQPSADSTAAEFRQYVDTVYSNLFSRPTKLRPFEGRLTVFDLAGLKAHPNLQKILIALIGFSLDRQMGDKSVRKLIIIDEGWELFKKDAAAELIEALYRQARKQNGAILSISQSLKDFLESSVSNSVMTNIHWVMALKMADGHELLSKFNFTDQAIGRSRGMDVKNRTYAEVLLRFGKASRVVRIAPSSLEYWIATTNAEEAKIEEQNRKEKGLTFLESIREMAQREPVKPW